MDTRLRAFVIYVGFFGMLAQILMLRELVAAFYGNELVLGIALGCWLWWTGLGSLVLSRWVVPQEHSSARARSVRALMVAVLTLPAGMAAVRLARFAMSIEVTAVCGLGPALATSFVALSGVCLSLGVLFPLCCCAAGSDRAASAGRIYVLEAVGAARGAGADDSELETTP